MPEIVERIRTFAFTAERDQPYLGPLGPRDFMTSRGYLIRGHSGTIYPSFDRSVVVEITTRSGIVGWGETYGLVAPRVIAELIEDVAAEFVLGKDACDPAAIHDLLYGLMRVRGYTGGFWLDALAALDIALWDIAAQAKEVSLAGLLDPSPPKRLEGYVSGLPGATLDERVAGARAWAQMGFDKFKFALAVADDAAEEFRALREALGPDAKIAIDMHWLPSAAEALRLCQGFAEYRPWFVEAPCMPEDVAGLADVCAGIDVPIAVGEEWRTVHDARLRVATGIRIVQPEMGHAGVTEALRIIDLVQPLGIEVMPHATIGMGIFLSASLQVARSRGVAVHEYQHSILDMNQRYLEHAPSCAGGVYQIPDRPGIGAEPSAAGLARMDVMTEARLSRSSAVPSES